MIPPLLDVEEAVIKHQPQFLLIGFEDFDEPTKSDDKHCFPGMKRILSACFESDSTAVAIPSKLGGRLLLKSPENRPPPGYKLLTPAPKQRLQRRSNGCVGLALQHAPIDIFKQVLSAMQEQELELEAGARAKAVAGKQQSGAVVSASWTIP